MLLLDWLRENCTLWYSYSLFKSVFHFIGYLTWSFGYCTNQNGSTRQADVQTAGGKKRLTQTDIKTAWREFSYLSSSVHNSGSLVGVQVDGIGTGTARTQGTTGCGRWCWASVSGSIRQRRRLPLTAASRWCRQQPPAHILRPPPHGQPSHH